MNDFTKGKPTKKLKIVNQCKINDFRAMIKETLEAMDKVLAQRTNDLEVWGEKEQAEFYKIFGSRGERIIEVEMSLRGDHHKVKMTAREVMQDCIRRLRWIKEKLTLDDFINNIYDPDNPNDSTNTTIPRDPSMPETFAAFVNNELVKEYKVHIGINFTGRIKGKGIRTCATVTGIDSRVSTLCHEMSHFVKIFNDPQHGGMGTSDYDLNGMKPKTNTDNFSAEQHNKGATTLVKQASECVFDNAYNIERYFEIVV